MSYPKKIKTSESSEQRRLFRWAKYINGLEWMFSIPNGGFRNKREAFSLKLQGVKAGVPDIFLPLPNDKFHGLFIEMKMGRNKPTKAQQNFMSYASNNGYLCKVCYSCEEAIKLINDYLKGTDKINDFFK